MKRILMISGALAAGCILAIFILNFHINRSTRPFIYQDVRTIPAKKAGVLLGTSKFARKGKINEYWKYRIEAALSLYKAGKIRCMIISGDNSNRYYDEPTVMKKELVQAGIPDSVIYLDYAGFRTFDSMIRAFKIFGQNNFTVISQEFQNQRAVYIARHNGIDAIGFNAREVSAYYGFKTQVREKLARVKVYIDLLFDKQPKFLGEKIPIK